MLLYSVYKGGKPFEASTIDAIYNCFLCGACKSWCEGQELGGYDIPELIKFARRDIVAQGLAPQSVIAIRNAVLQHDNTFGIDKSLSYTATVQEKPAPVLYLLGEGVNFRYPEIAQAFTQILDHCGENYTLLKDEPTSGKELDLLGYRQEAQEKAMALLKRIQLTGCTTIVVSDPLTYDALKNDYPVWGTAFEGEVLHVSEYLLRVIQSGAVRLSPYRGKVTLADSEFLGRFNKVYDAPREVIAAVPGVEVVEMQWNREYMQSAGEAALTFDDRAFDRGKDLGEKISTKAVEAHADTIVVLSATAKQHIAMTTDLSVVDIAEFVNAHIVTNN